MQNNKTNAKKWTCIRPASVFACQSCLHAMCYVTQQNWINFWKTASFFLDVATSAGGVLCYGFWHWNSNLKQSVANWTKHIIPKLSYGWLLFLVNVTIVTIILIIVNMQISFVVSHIFFFQVKLIFWIWKFFAIKVSYTKSNN